MAFRKPTDAELENRYRHHAPVRDQSSRYEKIRAAILLAAKECVDLSPCCPEQTRALNALDEAMFLFNAAIARNEQKEWPMRVQECPFTGCDKAIPESVFACRDHWFRLSVAQRVEIWRVHHEYIRDVITMEELRERQMKVVKDIEGRTKA